jgi:hypothetical protein
MASPAQEAVAPESGVEESTAPAQAYMNPYLAGIGIGLVLLAVAGFAGAAWVERRFARTERSC